MRGVSDRNITEQVTDELRSAIHTGAFAPGERLVERTLAAQLGVSHIPVREAFTRLADEGLIVREPRRGARVAELTAVDLEEISTLRIVLEQFMVMRVQERWSPQSAKRLQDIVETMGAAAPGDITEVLKQDQAFHDTLGELAEHRALSEVSAQLRGRIMGFFRAANSALPPADQLEHVRSHQEILDAIASGDPEQAKSVVSQHIESAVARIADQMAATGNERA